MASLSNDKDAGPSTGEELPQAGGRASGDKTSEHEHQMENGRSASPAAAASQPRRPQATVRERTVEVRETWSENVHGLDNLTLAINSLDDHVQAGLQEVRNCVGSLRHEKTELVKQVRSLSEAVKETSVQRDHYKEATLQLQQEIASLRDQLEMQKKDKEMLSKRMQEQEEQDEQHLESIAKTMRSKRLAHSSLVKWRKKMHEKSGRKALQLQMLQEENSSLRTELLLCQEAAKQAFLRSANTLNSEAITMFQDAATRRLGGDEEDDQERPSSPACSSSSTSSSSAQPQSAQNKDGFVAEGGRNKENMASEGHRGERTLDGWYREEESMSSKDQPHHPSAVPRQGERNVIYSTFRGNNRDHRLPHTSSAPLRTRWRGADSEEYEEVLDSGSFSHYVKKPSHSRRSHHEYHSRHESPLGWGEASGTGAIPRTRLTKSFLIPESLQQEARTRLQQLQRERYVRPEPSASSFEPQRKTKRVMPTQASGNPPKSCTCQPLSASATYKCPFCTPIHNSDYRHHKVTEKTKKKETSELHRMSSLTGSKVTKGDKKGPDKKVIYNPNACTVLIEKHINK